MDTSLDLLVVGGTNVVELSKLTDTKLKTLPVDAVVTCSVFDASGAPVANAQNIAMAYEPAVPANPPTPAIPAAYRGQIVSTVALVVGQEYTEKILVTQGGNVRPFVKHCLAVEG
jgi:hypothetical protein